MTSYLQDIVESSEWPVITAFALGLLTALSPCPLATNIASVAFVSKNISGKFDSLANGLLYALGRMAAYSVLGISIVAVLRTGGDVYNLERVAVKGGEAILPFFMIFCGIAVIFIRKIKLPSFSFGHLSEKIKSDKLGSFILGFIFALTFCPASAFLFFGMLIPLSLTAESGMFLPAAFGAATALPVVLLAVAISFGIGKIGAIYGRLSSLERFLRIIVGLTFAAIGLYYFYKIYIL